MSRQIDYSEMSSEECFYINTLDIFARARESANELLEVVQAIDTVISMFEFERRNSNVKNVTITHQAARIEAQTETIEAYQKEHKTKNPTNSGRIFKSFLGQEYEYGPRKVRT